MGVSVTVFQRGKNSFRLRARWKDPETGELREHTQTVRGTLEYANAQKRVLEDAFANGKIEKLSKDTVKGYIQNWLNRRVAMGKIRVTTAGTYRKMLTLFFAAFGDDKLVSVKPSALADWVSDTAAVKGLQYVGFVCTILKKAWKDAVKEGMTPFNPFDRIETPAYTPGRKEATIGASDLKRLHDAIPTLPGKKGLLLWVAMETGMRRGELAGLRWSDVSEHGVIEVRQIVVRMDRQHFIHPPKTKRGRRAIKVSHALAEALNEHRGEPEHYVFGEGKEPGKPDQIGRQITAVLKKAGLGEFTAHDLRHAHATHLLKSGRVPVVAVSKRLGHARVVTTMDIYAHALEEDEAIIVDEIDNLLRSEN